MVVVVVPQIMLLRQASPFKARGGAYVLARASVCLVILITLLVLEN